MNNKNANYVENLEIKLAKATNLLAQIDRHLSGYAAFERLFSNEVKEFLNSLEDKKEAEDENA